MSDAGPFGSQGRVPIWAGWLGSGSAPNEIRPTDETTRAVVSQRIDFLRFVLICAIVYIHVPDPVTQAPWLAIVRSLVVDGFSRVGVPVLSAVSGYLFAASLQRKTYPVVLKAKVRTLLVPLILWNLPLVVALYFVEARELTQYQFHAPAFPFSVANWFDLVFGFENQPINYPLYFLRDLFVCCLIAVPFIPVARRAPLVALVVVMIVFATGIDGPLILRDVIAINFFVGYLVHRFRWDVTAWDAYAFPCLLAATIACVIFVVFPDMFRLPFMLLSPWLVWPAASLATRIKGFEVIRRQAAASIAIFVVHVPMLIVLWALFGKDLTGREYFILWLVAPAFVVAAAMIIYRCVHGRLPGVARWTFGSR